MRDLALIGAGGHGDVVGDCAAAMARWGRIHIFDDSLEPDRTIDALKQRGPDAFDAVIAIGDNLARTRIGAELEALGFALPAIIHPGAVVSASAEIAQGAVLMPGVIVNAHARIGPFAIINTSASVDHHCLIGPGVHVAPGAHLAGAVTVGAHSLIGIGAVVRQNIVIGSSVTVGANAAVIRDVADGQEVKGVPAR